MESLRASQDKKPFGVYILTICIFLRFGIFQFITDFNAIHDADRSTPFLIAVILIGRNVFVAGAAVWTFLGDNWGRISLLSIISLNVLWTIFTVITYVSFSDNEPNNFQIIYNSFNPVFWLFVCWWYLNKENVLEYFKKND